MTCPVISQHGCVARPHLYSKEREGARAGLGRCDVGQGKHYVPSGLRLPEGVHDVALTLAHLGLELALSGIVSTQSKSSTTEQTAETRRHSLTHALGSITAKALCT